MKKALLLLTIASTLSSLVPQSAKAADFTLGNLVVVRVGDGSTTLSSSAAAVSLLEYSTAGLLIQTLALPTAASGSDQALTLQGSATSEGFLKRSTDGNYLTLAGYGTAPGTASPSAATPATINRVIGRVNSSGTVNTTTALTDANSGSNIRSAITTDGNAIWSAGNGGSGQGGTAGVRSTTLGSTTSVRVDSTASNMRVVNIFNGQLYVSSSTTAGGGLLGVSTVGSGLPTTASSSSITPLPGMPLTGTHSPYDFWFLDSDTLYVADDSSAANGGGIQKWEFDGNTWSLQYILLNTGTTTTAVRGLIGVADGANVNLFATTGSSLIGIVDTGVNTSTFATIASAGANYAFRGIAFTPSPIPEPTVLTLAVLGGLAGLVLRRKKS